MEAQSAPARRHFCAAVRNRHGGIRSTRIDSRRRQTQQPKRFGTAGTKTHTRDRIARVADWTWPIFWACAKDHLPTARLWRDSLTRFTVSEWHRTSVRGLKLPAYPLKNARHAWVVRMLRGGAPVHVVEAQLGHSTAKLTVDTCGRWLPGSEDRARAEAQVAEAEAPTSNHTSRGVVGEQGRGVSSTAAIAAG